MDNNNERRPSMPQLISQDWLHRKMMGGTRYTAQRKHDGIE